MRYWKNLAVNFLFILLAAVLVIKFAQANNSSSVAIKAIELSQQNSEIYLSTQLEMQLTEAVKVALYKGISVNFIVEANIWRKRWYWSDVLEKDNKRYIQLKYEPLLDKWQVSFSRSAKGLSFKQEFERFNKALAAINRFYLWNVIDVEQLDSSNKYMLEFKFFLDESKLPKIIRIGGMWQQDWGIAVTKTMPLDFPVIPVTQNDKQ